MRLPWSIALLTASRSASSTNSSFPRTQRDRAIRLMSQSANGEIRPVSLRSQVCTSSGAPEGGLRSADCKGLKLPTQIISAISRRHSFAPFRKNSIVTGVVPLFRHAWRVPFLHDDVAALEVNGFGVIKLQPNLAFTNYGVVDAVRLVHCRIFFFKVIG